MKKLFIFLLLGMFCISFGSAYFIGTVQQVGNNLSISGAGNPSITSLNSTRIAFIDSGNDQLRTYDWNGTDWSQVGNGLSISGVGNPSITSLNSTRIAFIDSGNDQLRTYNWNGTDWSQVGNGLSISGAGVPRITSLNSTRIAFIDGTNDQLRTYNWNGTDWSQVGNGLSISSVGTSSITSLNSTRIAFIDSENKQLRTYDWNGTDWSQVGSSLSISSFLSSYITSLNSNRVAFIDEPNDQLRTYDWNDALGTLVINSGNVTTNYGVSPQNHTINFTATDSNLDKCWIGYNSINTSIACSSGVLKSYNFVLKSGLYTATIYANDTAGGIKSEVVNFNYKVIYNSETYVNTTYAGVSNTFTINITSPNISTLMVNYNGTNYTAASYPSGSDTIGSVNIVAPVFSNNANVSFYWLFTMLDGSVVNGSSKNQTINIIKLGNSYSNLIYNISIRDEASGAIIPNNNVTMSYSVTYGTTNTSLFGTVLFNDNKLVNKNISLDVNSNIYMTGSIAYSAAGYIGRTYSFTESSINSTTYKNITLYLSNTSSSYVKTIQVTDEAGRGKPALFFQYTDISGVKTLVATEQLDSTGRSTIVFVPNIQYTFEFITTGCQDLTKNIIFYDQSDYTQVLSCSTYDPDDYADPFENMRVSFFPSGVFYVNNATNTSNSLFSVNISGNSAFCSNINIITFNVKNSLGVNILSDSANTCDVLTGSGFFNDFATGTAYILLDSGEQKTLTFRWIKSYSDADYSNYSILTLLGEVGNSDDILGIDWKFKLLICFIGLLGIIITLTIYQKIHNFSNIYILIAADVYLWFICFIGWGDLNIGAAEGGITALISKYALFILSLIGTMGLLASKEDEYS